MALDPVQPGQPFRPRAADWNAFAEAARAHRADAAPGPQRGAAGRDGTPGIIWIRNNSGAAISRFGVLALGLPIIAPDDNESEFAQRVTLEGQAPSVPDDLGRFAVLLDRVPASGIGRALVAGACQVRIEIGEGEEGPEYADVADGQTAYLAPREDGSARVLWCESGTGTKWAVVLLGAPPPPTDGLWMEITGGDQASGWEWKEKEGTSGGGWQDLSGGRTHTSDGVAYCTRDIVEVVTGTVVFARPVTLAAGGTQWRFDPPLPTPDTAYEVLATNGDGDRWIRDDVRSPGSA